MFPRTDPRRKLLFISELVTRFINPIFSVPLPQPTPPRSTPDRFVGNPYLIHNALSKVDHAFGDVIAVLEQEKSSQETQDDALLEKFRMWRNDLQDIRSGKVQIRSSGCPDKEKTLKRPYHEGGLFVD